MPKTELHSIKYKKVYICIVTRSNYSASTGPLFVKHGILPLETIMKQTKLQFMHAVEDNYAPTSFATT
jgi:hypothetical protein